MIRKRIAILFVLFATILLLAHAFVPHHHHKDHICLSPHHCSADGHAHESEIPINDHQHDGQNDSEFCVLKQAVFIPSHQNYFDKYWPGNDKPLPFLDFQAIVFANEWISDEPGIVLSVFECTADSNYSQFAISSSGLRAPPAA